MASGEGTEGAGRKIDTGMQPTHAFEEIPGGEIRRRFDKHHRKSTRHAPGEVAYRKGLKVKNNVDRTGKKQQIKEGVETWEEGNEILLDTYNDLYDNDVDIVEENGFLQCSKAKTLLDEWKKEENPTPFNPWAELKGLQMMRRFASEDRVLSQEEKRLFLHEKLNTYKNELLAQEVGKRQLIANIWNTITDNPDINEQQLNELIFLEGSAIRLNSEQRGYFLKAIEAYAQKHAAVTYYAETYPDPENFYTACFQKYPQGKVDVSVGSMTVLFRCFDASDYAEAEFFGEDQSQFPTPEDKLQAAMKTGGVALRDGAAIPELQGTIIVENAAHNKEGVSSVIRDTAYSLAIKQHEEQHQFNKLFSPLEQTQGEAAVVASVAERATRFHPDEPEKTKQHLIHQLVRLKRKQMGMDTQARDEIIAYFRDGEHTRQETINFLTQDNALYDYKNMPVFQYHIASIPDYIRDTSAYYKDLYGNLGVDVASITDEEVGKFIDVVFGQEYKRDIAKWVGAMGTLEAKGYSRTDILTFLYSKPVSAWVPFARRVPAVHKYATL